MLFWLSKSHEGVPYLRFTYQKTEFLRIAYQRPFAYFVRTETDSMVINTKGHKCVIVVDVPFSATRPFLFLVIVRYLFTVPMSVNVIFIQCNLINLSKKNVVHEKTVASVY